MKTRPPPESAVLAHYLFSPDALTLIQDTIHAELKAQQADKVFILFRGHISSTRIAGAIAEAMAEHVLSQNPFQPHD